MEADRLAAEAVEREKENKLFEEILAEEDQEAL